MKKHIHQIGLLALSILLSFFTLQVNAQTITIGTGTTTNSSTSYPTPYGAWYSQSRSQMLILASELSGLGLTGATTLTSLSFSVTATNGAGTHQNFQIKLKNTTASALTSAWDNTGLTTVFGPVSFTPSATGWVNHPFATTFIWDGTSNLLVDVCHDNGNSNYTYSLSVNSSTTSFVSVIQAWSDGVTGTMCPVGITPTSYSTRPNMRFDYIPSSPGATIPPLAGFAYNINFDTAWINNPYIFVNTSNNSKNNYWDIIGYSSTLNGTYSAFTPPPTNPRICATRWNTCYIDTVNTNFSWKFTQVGYYKVKLKCSNNYGVDSITKIVVCAPPSRKPIASFFSLNRSVGFTDQLNYYDLSSNGPTSWRWFLNPSYYGVNTFAGYPIANSWYATDSVQNPYLYAFDGGIFDVCLAAGNSLGWDTICRHSYLTVNNGYMMCNGSDSVSFLS
ncbi:MAG: hypothetical protein WCO28_09720, partial [Bacteroidota bacterium]